MRTRSRILGIDPGSRTTGYGIIDKQGSNLGFVACGTIRTGGSGNIPERLLAIFEGLEKIISLHGPDVAAVEEVFMARNPRSALTLGHARGAAVLAVMRSGLRVHDYSPRLVKQAVAGYGRADKAQVQHMVTALLDLSAAPSSDAADALAVAICHANRMIVPEDASS
ncbi:MAG: crossover junction endodeoxyribonuclease RuvC [Desulfobulbaceae bacterium]|nr:crossover junction endodeoxyribonuclease RuvC [Desulfobulbaceae bacterium]MDY0349648.1 crossover junction endodeoxyribonuclease RuvC [Desulfobulbaceae bacterium]